jgi:hypothetical protein
MKKAFLCSCVLLLAGSFALSQTTSGARMFDGSVELISHATFAPKKVNGKFYQTHEAHTKSTFDMLSLSNGCRSALCIYYGDRAGDNWDMFHIGGGAVDRTRMVPIGEYKWTDDFTAPRVEPWAALAPGEVRIITVNTSGADGRDGADGGSGVVQAPRSPKNEDYAHATLDRQVGSSVKAVDGTIRKDPYSPVVEAKLGNMYIVRVIDITHDYYLLLRVDELKRGERVVLSYKKVELP